MHVLLIEDDIQLNTTVTNFLQFSNYKVTSLYDGNMAIEAIDTTEFSFYIIDINIPHINGLEIVNYIRQKDLHSPVIIITASMELDNFQTAFDNGCDEYIKKPFYLEELEIRMNKLIHKKNDTSVQISDTIFYNMEFEELRIHNEIVKLRKKERRLLTLLLQNINHCVPSKIIENYVWENEIKESYPLRQLVNDLRKKFSIDKNYIFADRGLGYKFETKD
ncbi:response regulator transcription factor [Sulfurimonas sp.]